MRAKFRIAKVEKSPEGVNPPYEKLVMDAVTDKPFDAGGNSEDNSFSKWTPTGNLEMTITNPDLHGKFEIGEKYYLDFTKAES